MRSRHTSRVLSPLVGAVLALAACEDARSVACRDDDDDGYGVGCGAGLDCDDTDPERNVDCDVVVPPDCDVRPFSPGCPCLPRDQRQCGSVPDAAVGVGACRTGVQLCLTGGFWDVCEGDVGPVDEVCNGVDDDCDGEADEGVQSPCGGCDAGCEGSVWGADGAVPFVGTSDLAVDASGSISLARAPVEPTSFVWVPSAEDGLVAKIDARDARVVARYPSGGADPGRVAVDYLGDAWIANRAFDDQSTLTRIAGSLERCEERNGVPGVQTSTGETLPEGEDECVLFTVPVGGPGAVARALAIDGTVGLDGEGGGHVWVGLHGEEAVIELDPDTGETLDRVELPGLAPFGAAVDPFGELWVVSRDGLLARIDRGRRPLEAEVIEVPRACFLSYGVDVDTRGRLYLSGFSCDLVHRYEPELDRWSTTPVDESPRGVAVAGEQVWIAHMGGLLTALTTARDFGVEAVVDLWALDRMPTGSVGVSVDDLGGVWIVSADGGASGEGLATRVDGPSRSVDVHVPVGLAPHVLGDLTGAALRGGFRPEGVTRAVFEGCPDGVETEWERVHVDYRSSGVGSVTLRVRHAPARAGLSSAEQTTLGTLPDVPEPLPLDLPDGGVIEVELTLATAARDGAPRVDRVGVEWRCGDLG